MKAFTTLTAEAQFVIRTIAQSRSIQDFKLDFKMHDQYRKIFNCEDKNNHSIYRRTLKILNDLTAAKVLKKETIWMSGDNTRSGKNLTTSRFTFNKKWAAENRENITNLAGGKAYVK